MIVEIINTGSELLLGRTLNTHQQWLCRQLTTLGYAVSRQITVNDTAEDIDGAVRESLSRADIVITTGGLGPTSDDLTRDRLAVLVGAKLVEDPAVLANIKGFFAARNRPAPESTFVQAMVPEGARVLPNHHGTAPGLALKLEPNPFRPSSAASWLILLPGPPGELHPMFTDSAAPWLRAEAPPAESSATAIFKTTGLGESLVEQKIAEPLAPMVRRGLDIGYCAKVSEVEVRLTARGPAAAALIAEAAPLVERLLGPIIFGGSGDELEACVVARLTQLRHTLSVAESCTGGFLAHRLTNVPGASAVFHSGWVTYSNEAKTQWLGVSAATLATQGAVSEPVARAMAEGARQRAASDYALALTGIAGPSGGTESKPAGTVFVACAAPSGTTVNRALFPYDRATFKFAASQLALDMLRRRLLGT